MSEISNLRVYVMFCVPEYNIPRKIYNYSILDTLKDLKSLVLIELDHWGVSLTDQNQLNYSLALVDCTFRPIRFVPEHFKISTIFDKKDKVIDGYLCFMFKRRLNFPVALRREDITKNNRGKKRQHFLRLISLEDVNNVQKALLKGLDPNFCDPDTLNTPLFVWGESFFPSEQILSLLVNHGAHLNFRVPSGHCIIHKAILTENLKSIKLLHNFKASLEEFDSYGLPAFFYSLNRDIHILCIELMLELGIDFNSTDSSNNNLFHHCCKHGLANHLGVIIKYISSTPSRAKLVQYLYRLNNSGNTPLHVAVLNKQRGCVELLLQCGINVNIRNNSKDTPHELAVRNNEFHIKKLFEMYDGSYSNITLYTSIDQNSYSPKISFKRGTLKKSSTKSTINSRKFKFSTCLRNSDSNAYPRSFKAIHSFVSSSADELDVLQNDIISVYIILQTRIAFGCKTAMDGETCYGWFPSPCIGITDFKDIDSYRTDVSTIDRIVLTVPFLASMVQAQHLPILVNVRLSSAQQELGIELGFKYCEFPWNLRPISSVAMQASPVYIRRISADSPADLAGFRIGDQILMVVNIDVTTLKLKNITSILKNLCKEQIPDNYPSNASKQLFFLVARNNDNCLNLPDNKSWETKSSNYDTFCTKSPLCQATEFESSEIQTSKTSRHSKVGTRRSSGRKHHVPLPPIPTQKNSLDTRKTNFDHKDHECSLQDISFEDLPLPPPELLC